MSEPESPSPTTDQLQRCLKRLQAGDESARQELLEASVYRLTHLTRKMFHDWQKLRRFTETDDLFQQAAMRLWNALEKVTPPTVLDFYRLASWHIRCELADTARKFLGPSGKAFRARALPTTGDESGIEAHDPALAETADNPGHLAEWCEFHEQIAALPEEERQVIDLLFYQGLSRKETAELLEIDPKTVSNRRRRALVRIGEALEGEFPSM